MGGKAPKAPDPVATAAAQGSWDLTTSKSNAVINNPNTVNPYGSTTYSIAGYETIDGPNGQKIRVPRYTSMTSLSPVAQKQFDDRNALIGALSGKAATGGSTYDVAKLDTGFGSAMLDDRFRSATLDKGFLRPEEASMATDRSRVEQSIMARANPLLEESRNSEVARLAAMGLAPGGEKYGRVADQFEKSRNDLALAAVGAGGQEQSRLLDLFNRGTANINDARLAETQSINNANSLTNATRLAQVDSRNNATGLSNQAKTTQTSMNAGARQSLINELLAMITGQQPGAQAQTQYQGFGMQSPDFTGLTQNKYQADVGAYNNRQQGIMGLITAGLGLI